MDSWFGKLREKLVAEKVVEEDSDSDEERKRKEEKLRDTLHKLNTDDVLNDDEIARISETIRRPVKEPAIENKQFDSSKDQTDVSKSSKVLQKPGPETEQEKKEPVTTTGVTILDDDEHYGSQFWD